MNQAPCILLVDDEEVIRELFEVTLSGFGYRFVTASNGEEAVQRAVAEQPDVILMDVTMPVMDGAEACRRIRAVEGLPYAPIIMITALGDTDDVVAGLDAGADEYLTKPVDSTALIARVKSMLRIKTLYDTIQQQAAVLGKWNEELEERVNQQVTEISRIQQLKKFFSPQIVEVLLKEDADTRLISHKQDITAVFCDLRGFTAFAESAPSEELMDVLREYQSNMGELIFEFNGTLEHFAGDGIMVFFNDPHPCPDHELTAVKMGAAMRNRMRDLTARWKERGYDLNFGIGIATGTATLGLTGFEGRQDYSAVGPVVNLAARLSDAAEAGQILITRRVLDKVAPSFDVAYIEDKPLKGFSRAVSCYNVVGLKGM